MKYSILFISLTIVLIGCSQTSQSDTDQRSFDISDLKWNSLNFPTLYERANVFNVATNTNNDVFASNGSGQLYRQLSGDTSWTLIKWVGLNHITFIYIDLMDRIFIGYVSTEGNYGSGVLSSNDNGENWSTIYNYQNDINNFTVFNDTIFVVRYGGIAVSPDYGQNWKLLNNGIDNMNVQDFVINIQSGTFFIGTWRYGILKSVDRGETWQNSGFENWSIFPLHSTENGDVFACSGFGLNRTKDDGSNWQKLTNGIPEADIRSITSNSSGFLLAGTWENGLYLSLDNGDEWSNIGLENNEIRRICFDTENYVYIGTDSLGVIKSNKKFKKY